jgi:hypothetical protein
MVKGSAIERHVSQSANISIGRASTSVVVKDGTLGSVDLAPPSFTTGTSHSENTKASCELAILSLSNSFRFENLLITEV